MELIDRLSIRNKLYEADAITMRGVSMLNQEPTVDAVPVVHARWITTRTIMHDGEPYCSACGEDAPSEYGRYTYICSDYCPNCGAKMDGKENS